MKSFLKTLFIIGGTNAAAGAWDYTKNGSDWPQVDVAENECGTGSNQSPIDLKTSGWTQKHSNFDNFNKIYTDQNVDVEIKWNGHTSQVELTKTGQSTQTIHSKQSEALGGGSTYNGVQFHFHHGSEHTVDGVRQDLEMHTVHLAVGEKSGFFAAAMGIMFSVNNPSPGVSADDVAIIDEFFESLQWNEVTKSPLVEKVPYGKLMMMFDMRNRWTYKGSVTTPPCKQNVYWNVLRTVYPIKQKYVDQFQSQLERLDGLLNTGNWRQTLPLTVDHNPVVLYSEQGVGSQFAPGASKTAASTTASAGAATTTTPATAAPAATTPMADALAQVVYRVSQAATLQQFTPYPQQQRYYAQPQQPVVVQVQAPAAAPAAATPKAPAAAATTPSKKDDDDDMDDQKDVIPEGFMSLMVALVVGVFLLVAVIVLKLCCQLYGRQPKYVEARSSDYQTNEMAQSQRASSYVHNPTR